MSTLFESLEFLKKKAESCFLESKEHPSIFFLETPDGIGLMPAFFSNNEEKDKVLNLLKQLINAGKVSGFIFVGEAWVKTVDSIESIREEYKKHGSLKFAAGREEILMFQYQSFEHNLFFKAHIKRDGESVTLGSWEEIKVGKSSSGLSTGRFDNLFEQAKAASN